MSSTTGRGKAVGIVVYDLATLRFRRSSRKTSMSVVAASGEVLAVVDTLAIDSNEDAAYAACEHALSAGRVRRDGRYRKVGLYNPYSGEISYKAAPDSVVFGCEKPISIETLGSCGEVFGENGVEELHIGETNLPRREVGVVQASRAWESSGEGRRA
jgi:hypothetical protein